PRAGARLSTPPYTTLFRSILGSPREATRPRHPSVRARAWATGPARAGERDPGGDAPGGGGSQRNRGTWGRGERAPVARHRDRRTDRKSTRLNSSHVKISYA